MKSDLPVSRAAYTLVSSLQQGGYESYIVGGAIRDLLLGRTPKDFDIATSATPEEIRAFFGRRNCHIIGKRFRLAHVFVDGMLFEVSTFRRNPQENTQKTYRENDGLKNDNLIIADNAFGTAQEDAFRRDFTVNALFYDPVKKEILDFTGMGLVDIAARKVRAIGDPALRFEEDPVRMLRALKLVGMFDFELDNATENALFSRLKLLLCAAASRLSLEWEKILQSNYCDRHLEVFHDYGLLKYFLPFLDKNWGTPECQYAIKLLFERDCRIEEKQYRNSVSLALALLALPFVEKQLSGESGMMYTRNRGNRMVISDTINRLLAPLPIMLRIKYSAEKILDLLPDLIISDSFSREIFRNRSYNHAREAAIIIGVVSGLDPDELACRWPEGSDNCGRKNDCRRKPQKNKKNIVPDK